MHNTLTLIGYGEAGQTFARAAGWESQAQVFDAKINDSQLRAAMLANYEADGVTGADHPADALDGSSAILSLVIADQALAVAADVCFVQRRGQGGRGRCRGVASDAIVLDAQGHAGMRGAAG